MVINTLTKKKVEKPEIKEKIVAMVNGLPGNMATKVAEYIVNNPNSFTIMSYSLTGPEIEEDVVWINNDTPITLIKQHERDKKIKMLKGMNIPFTSVDFVAPPEKLPTNVEAEKNIEFYCKNKLPFVMGSTGVDTKDLEKKVNEAGIAALYHQNMAKQIVAFEKVISDFADKYPDGLKDCKLLIEESHQQGKKDTSGTAKHMVGYFNKLGIDFSVENIIKIRDPEEQRELFVPEKFLGGHGWHTYKITANDLGKGNKTLGELNTVLLDFLEKSDVFSDYTINEQKQIKSKRRFHGSGQIIRKLNDNTVEFQMTYMPGRYILFSHRVNGRDIYAKGTLDAIRFLDKKIKNGEKGLYNMIDVLSGK